MQLDACLSSIERAAPYAGPIVVIYKATTPEFAEGYRSLDLSERVRLVQQSDDFRRDVMQVLDSKQDYTVFHTDDDVFFRPPPIAPVMSKEFVAFSLRLGENTTYHYPADRSQRAPAKVTEGHLLAWDWTRASDDFAYPMSLNGHVFHTRLLVRMLSRAPFGNPNELEDELHVRRYLAPPRMLAFRESCVVSIPVNVVSSTHHNRAAEHSGWSPDALNDRFLAGERIDLEAMDFSAVVGAHQEVALAFKSTGTEP